MTNDTIGPPQYTGPQAPLAEISSVNWEFVAGATALRELIASQAADAEKNRAVSDEVVEAVRDAGLTQILVPKRLGGSGQNARTLIDAVAEVSRADGSTGWLVAQLTIMSWVTTLFPEKCLEDVFGGGGDVCGTLQFMPGVTATKGGYRITGRWPTVTGSPWSKWAILSLQLPQDGTDERVDGFAIVPREDFEIHDTWYTASMAATGTHAITVDDIFVPEHRVTTFAHILADDHVTASPEGREQPGDFFTFGAISANVNVGVYLGCARGAVDATYDRAVGKQVAYTGWKVEDSPPHQIALAKALMGIDLAYLSAVRLSSETDIAAAERRRVEDLQRARITADAGHIGTLCRDAIGLLLTVNGSSAFASSQSIQRAWRDVESVSRHGYTLPELTQLQYGREVLGVEGHVLERG